MIRCCLSTPAANSRRVKPEPAQWRKHRKIVKTYRNGDNVEKYAYLASLKEIQDNDYNLNIPRHVDTFEEEDEIDPGGGARAEREQLKVELASWKLRWRVIWSELGYGA